jgi:hypothetical protein
MPEELKEKEDVEKQNNISRCNQKVPASILYQETTLL